MSIAVICSCGKKLLARKEHIGKRAKCPKCGQMMLVAAPVQAAEPQTAGIAATADNRNSPDGAPPLYNGQPVRHWFDMLGSSDAAERRKAADVLAGVGPEAAGELSTLVDRTSDDNMLLRLWATVCLGQIGPAANDALPAILDRLNDEQPLVRDKAARAIEQIIPTAKPFLPHLLRGLNDRDDDRRAAAIELFRRDLQTAGISRFRFWACTCGRVYVKLDLDQRLRKLVESPDEVDWSGKRTCGQCGAQYEDRRVFAGEYDVPEPHWPKLRSKFGPQLSVPDDFLADAQIEAGYQLSGDARVNDPLPSMPSLSPFSVSLDSPASLESDGGYAIAEPPPPPPIAALGPRRGAEQTEELTPGVEVPRSGRYKCVTCGKQRLGGANKQPARTGVVMQFKSGKTFSECPECGDLTEWKWVG